MVAIARTPSHFISYAQAASSPGNPSPAVASIGLNWAVRAGRSRSITWPRYPLAVRGASRRSAKRLWVGCRRGSRARQLDARPGRPAARDEHRALLRPGLRIRGHPALALPAGRARPRRISAHGVPGRFAAHDGLDALVVHNVADQLARPERIAVRLLLLALALISLASSAA